MTYHYVSNYFVCLFFDLKKDVFRMTRLTRLSVILFMKLCVFILRGVSLWASLCVYCKRWLKKIIHKLLWLIIMYIAYKVMILSYNTHSLNPWSWDIWSRAGIWYPSLSTGIYRKEYYGSDSLGVWTKGEALTFEYWIHKCIKTGKVTCVSHKR